MVKSMLGLGCKNKALMCLMRPSDFLYQPTIYRSNLSAARSRQKGSYILSSFTFKRFSLFIPSQQPRSLTDLTHSLNQPDSVIGFFTGLLTVMVSGLSFMTMPPREKKRAARLINNLSTLVSSLRYSLAQLGLKGDQT
ncbi:hypothetical protein [Rouxiella chamberiensis]|uniref:Uncharacterized protein n=1 Tax=Rouxiella chamberiensis TaxID=1513468 RepID=A0ABY7HS95_9GAMM|nr:hypothetical protein [Rouxiella chamberiensis]WAT02235.1 hypothetical protein O1V66_06230 [Rouxiella chamberiensis]